MNHSRTRAAFLLMLLALGAAMAQDHTLTTAPPQLGKLYDLGGYKLHLYCTGKGQPAVILSIGSGDFSFDWMPVQQRVAAFTQVCSYDRGGEAWSDLGPNPHTHRQEAYDLRRLLNAAGVKGPFVLVGQSMGGTVVREFARQYPQDVSGMVLVDAGHENALFSEPKRVISRTRDLEGKTHSCSS